MKRTCPVLNYPFLKKSVENNSALIPSSPSSFFFLLFLEKLRATSFALSSTILSCEVLQSLWKQNKKKISLRNLIRRKVLCDIHMTTQCFTAIFKHYSLVTEIALLLWTSITTELRVKTFLLPSPLFTSLSTLGNPVTDHVVFGWWTIFLLFFRRLLVEKRGQMDLLEDARIWLKGTTFKKEKKKEKGNRIPIFITNQGWWTWTSVSGALSFR